MSDLLTARCRKRLSPNFEANAQIVIPDTAAVTVLFGPSGSGKTTLLRMIAGLERPDAGAIVFRDRTWFDKTLAIDLAPQQRRAGFLFQDYALFPHLTVAGNITYAAKAERSRAVLEAFQLQDLADRRPGALSGGQQQRVALARAIATDPALLLLDEPLSALDAATRLRTRGELRRMLLASGVPSIVVTHDRMEAVALGDWMAVIIDGQVRQSGPVQEVFRRPADLSVAESVGVENVLAAEIVGRAAGLLTLAVGEACLQCVDSGETGAVFACIRAEDVALSREPELTSSVRNRLTGRITCVTPEGALARVELDSGFPLVALVTAQSASDLKLLAGDRISAIIKATSVHLAAHAAPFPTMR